MHIVREASRWSKVRVHTCLLALPRAQLEAAHPTPHVPPRVFARMSPHNYSLAIQSLAASSWLLMSIYTSA